MTTQPTGKEREETPAERRNRSMEDLRKAFHRYFLKMRDDPAITSGDWTQMGILPKDNCRFYNAPKGV